MIMLVLAFLLCLTWPGTQGQISGDLRLFGGNSSAGRLEIYYSGTWGTVCDDRFDGQDTRVACRQLGYTGYFSYGDVGDYGYPQGFSRIWLDDLDCSGFENTLLSCSHNGLGNHNCEHHEDVAVSCSGTFIAPTQIPSTGSTGSVRLVAKGGQTSSALTAGRLEVYYNGEWGTVCDDAFTSSEAAVICRQLGFSSYLRFGTVGRPGTGFDLASSSTPIWLDNFFCSSTDNSLNDCTISSGIGVHNCDHNEDVALFCLGDGALRLSSRTSVSSSPSSGRLEIYYNGEWGTVCDDSFGQTDANVACRQLGYDFASSFGDVGDLGQSQASSSTDILLDEVQCSSFDIMLSSCEHNGFGVENCVHSEDVAVSCSYGLEGISAGAIAGITVGVLLPCICIGILCIACGVAACNGAFSSNRSSSNRNVTNSTTTAAPKPYPTAPTVVTATTVTQPHTGTLQPSAPQEPPPPYPGTQNTYPVQPQPAVYRGYPQGNVPYPAAPYQPYPGAQPTVASAPPPSQAQAYDPSALSPVPVASAPPPQVSAPYPAQPQPHPGPGQAFEMQQYASPQQQYPPPTIPGQAVYPSDPGYTAHGTVVPYPTGDTNQMSPPQT